MGGWWMSGWLAEQTGEVGLRYGDRSQLVKMGEVLGLTINIFQLTTRSASLVDSKSRGKFW